MCRRSPKDDVKFLLGVFSHPYIAILIHDVFFFVGHFSLLFGTIDEKPLVLPKVHNREPSVRFPVVNPLQHPAAFTHQTPGAISATSPPSTWSRATAS